MLLQVIVSTDRRGSEVFAMDLATALRAGGREVRTVALARRATGAQVPATVLGDRRLGISTLAALRREVRQASVVIAHGSTTLPACAAATVGTGVPFIYRSIGDPTYWAAPPVRRLRSAACLARASAVVALWKEAGDAITRLFRVSPRKIHVIPNGVPSARFPLVDARRRAAARELFDIPLGTPVVLYMGALTAEKNVGMAILAMRALPSALLLISGEGPERASLGALAERSGSHVRFLGSTDDPATVLAAADAVVLPSHSEGLPAVLIEAGLSGIPAVATDVGGIREIIDHGKTGLLVAPGDATALASAIQAVLLAPGRMAMAAREHCLSNLDIGVVARQWSDIVGSMCRQATTSGLSHGDE